MAQPLDLTTPQGTRLTGYGDVTFAGGTVRRMFDAALDSNDTDTPFAGEDGRGSWQAGPTLTGGGKFRDSILICLSLSRATRPRTHPSQ